MTKKCDHLKFVTTAAVFRLTKSKGGPVTGYTAEIGIHCSDCGRKFQFLGMPAGTDSQRPTTSVDGLEARMPICPQGEKPSWLDRAAADIGPKGKTH